MILNVHRLLSTKPALFMGTINKVAIDFVPVNQRLRPNILTKEGIKERIFRARRFISYLYSRYRVRKLEHGFASKVFAKEAGCTYEDMWSYFSRHDVGNLRTITTEKLFSELKNKMKFNRLQQLTGSIKVGSSEIVDMIVCRIETECPVEICQITVKLCVNVDQKEDVHYIVFEKPLMKNMKWRICGRVYESDKYYRIGNIRENKA